MTFSNPPTFLPPVLATGQGQSANGRQQLGSGLVTHRGIIDANSFRAQGRLYPQSGAGVEIQYDQSTKGGFVIAYDRDIAAYTDLNIGAQNITLTPHGAGKVSLPAGTAQALIGSYRAVVGYTIPAAGAWYETPIQVSATTSGSPVRLETCGTLVCGLANQLIYVGMGIDGTIPLDSQMVQSLPTVNAVVGFCAIGYLTPAAGLHRFSTFLYMNAGPGGGLWAGGYHSLWVTEQRA
jgi:hypothetical protein